MKITKYGQSCVLIETLGKRILIDPGSLEFNDELLENDWINIDVILVTHKHGDHCHLEAINKIVQNVKTKLYTTKEVADFYPEIKPEIIKEGDSLNIENIKIQVVRAVHGWVPAFKNTNKFVEENVGYIIDDGENKLYHTSDTLAFDNDYKCDILCAPICNHGVVMGSYEAVMFAKMVSAELLIPIHYDNPLYPVDLGKFKSICENNEVNYKVLDIGESVKI